MARLAVVADRSLAGYEWLMREAGAVHFVCSPRQVGPLAQLACRHLAQVPPPPAEPDRADLGEPAVGRGRVDERRGECVHAREHGHDSRSKHGDTMFARRLQRELTNRK